MKVPLYFQPAQIPLIETRADRQMYLIEVHIPCNEMQWCRWSSGGGGRETTLVKTCISWYLYIHIQEPAISSMAALLFWVLGEQCLSVWVCSVWREVLNLLAISQHQVTFTVSRRVTSQWPRQRSNLSSTTSCWLMAEACYCFSLTILICIMD